MKGFTLIELLVVVLIIGILSSVALPQYQKSVLKSRAAEAWTNLKNINMAKTAYCLENPGGGAPFRTLKDSFAINVSDSKNFTYDGDIVCMPNDSVWATYVGGGNYNFKLALHPQTGRRSCEGASCKELGFNKYSSDRDSVCICGAYSGCYYAD